MSMDWLWALLGVFPVSFLAFVLSERVLVIHQARVGRAISLPQFFAQHWADLKSDLRWIPDRRVWLLYLSQLSAAALLGLSLEGAFFYYLMLAWILIVLTTSADLDVFERVGSDRAQIRFLLGGLIAFICILGASVVSRSFNVVDWHFRLEFLIFGFPFQVAGMILFGEHPFSSLYSRVYWLRSSRFFVWSLLTAKIFLGGAWLGLGLYLKATGLYLLFRLIGQYFPKYAQEDWIRISLLYLVPLTFLLFVGVAVFYV